MRRRKFVAGTASAVASQLIPTGLAQTTGLSVSRTSRLFDLVAGGPVLQVQDLLVVNGLVYCLYFSLPSRSAGVSVTHPDGTVVWRGVLPPGNYSSIGMQNGTILLTALSATDSAGHSQMNCVIRLDQTGASTLLQTLGPSFIGRLVFAGDSRFLKVESAAVEVWQLSGSSLTGGTRYARQEHVGIPNIDIVGPDKAVLTNLDGTTLATVSLPSGAIEENAINVPEITRAIASYQNRTAVAGMGRPGVVVATGADLSGNLYGLVFPAYPTAVPVVKLDTAGGGSLWNTFQISTKVPARKLLVFPGEIGVAFANGVVSWFAV